MGSARIIIVYKYQALSHCVADFLTVAGMKVVDNARSLGELQEKAYQWKPHIILLDVRHAGDGFAVFLQNLKRRLPQVKLVFMGPEPHVYYAWYAATLGADLYLSEGQYADEWLRSLKAIIPSGEKPTAEEPDIGRRSV
jgi:DNA-binding NarL/FixJ family response regulator